VELFLKFLFVGQSAQTELDRKWRHIYIIGFYAFLFIICKFLFDFIYGVLIHQPIPDPTTTLGWFTLFKNDSFFGLFCFNFFDSFWMIGLIPFYIALFFSLFDTNRSVSLIALSFGLLGIISYLASNNALTFLQISNQYWTSSDNTIKEQMLSAGTTVIANGFGNGMIFGAIFIMVSGLTFSFLMFCSSKYRLFVPLFSIAAHVIGIIGILLHPQRADISFINNIILIFAIISYFLWYLCISITFLILGSKKRF
jgi:hypothetical protein